MSPADPLLDERGALVGHIAFSPVRDGLNDQSATGSRLRASASSTSGWTRLDYRLLADIHGRPRNGNADIYWVDAGVVTSL